MATTPIYAGGSRRGTAPRVAQRDADRTAALSYDADLMRQLLGSFAQQQSEGTNSSPVGAGVARAEAGGFMPSLSEALGSGTDVANFNTPNQGGIELSSLPGGGAGGSNFNLSTLATLIGSAGMLTENRPLQEIAGELGTASVGLNTVNALSRGDLTGAAVSGAPLAARALGVPMSAVNLGLSVATGNAPGMINSGISLASPLAGAGNALLNSVTSPALGGDQAVSIGDILTQYGFGRDVFGDVGPIDATQGAKILNALNSQDRLGALMALAGGTNTQLPTGAATGAANALSAAQNTDPMDALMRVSNAFGTADSIEASNSQIQNEQLKAIAGELAVEQGRMDTEARIAAALATAGIALPDSFTTPTRGQGLDFSVDMDSINRQLAELAMWESYYLASPDAGFDPAYNSLMTIVGHPMRGGSVTIEMGDSDGNWTPINQYQYPDSSTTAPHTSDFYGYTWP